MRRKRSQPRLLSLAADAYTPTKLSRTSGFRLVALQIIGDDNWRLVGLLRCQAFLDEGRIAHAIFVINLEDLCSDHVSTSAFWDLQLLISMWNYLHRD